MAPLTPEQSLAARALLNWPRIRLGARCNISEGTIREFECGRRLPATEKLLAIRQAFHAAGVVFFGHSSSGRAIVKLRSPGILHGKLGDGEAGIIENSEM